MKIRSSSKNCFVVCILMTNKTHLFEHMPAVEVSTAIGGGSIHNVHDLLSRNIHSNANTEPTIPIPIERILDILGTNLYTSPLIIISALTVFLRFS